MRDVVLFQRRASRSLLCYATLPRTTEWYGYVHQPGDEGDEGDEGDNIAFILPPLPTHYLQGGKTRKLWLDTQSGFY